MFLDLNELLTDAEQAAEAQTRAAVTLYEARVRKADAKVALEAAKNEIALSLADAEAERQWGRDQTIRDARTDEATAELAAGLRAAERDVMAAEAEDRMASLRSQLVAHRVALTPLLVRAGQTR